MSDFDNDFQETLSKNLDINSKVWEEFDTSKTIDELKRKINDITKKNRLSCRIFAKRT